MDPSFRLRFRLRTTSDLRAAQRESHGQAQRKIYGPDGTWSKQLYRLGEASQLLVDTRGTVRLFNDAGVTEEWPTTHRRILRCGPFVFHVKPEDDSLSFDLLGQEELDILQAIIAFHLMTPANAD